LNFSSPTNESAVKTGFTYSCLVLKELRKRSRDWRFSVDHCSSQASLFHRHTVLAIGSGQTVGLLAGNSSDCEVFAGSECKSG
jgi:hypothetical protein